MMDHSSSQGTCQRCGMSTSKNEMLDHLTECTARSGGQNGQQESLYRLRIENRYGGSYWLDLELSAEAPLAQLDQFLRRIWLECCTGHTSAFEIDDTHYVAPFNERLAILPSERSMEVPLRDALISTNGTFIYDYDFDSPTHLMGQVTATRTGALGEKPVELLARNNPVERYCAECGNFATHVCSYYHENPFLCDVHASTHACSRYALLPVVNSPRMGVCSYQGQQSTWRRAV